ncbi:MAG: hypothetical protein J4F35_09345 [Candidatus Latescibacteria bacterium]|nr:hypothetical protein [Candidatus Latescibacterota bacterium]
MVFNLGFGNAFLHDTQVADHWAPEAAATAQFRPEDDHLWDHLVFQRAYRNAQQLIAEGRDLLHIVCDRARAKGLLIYPSLQVQADLGEGLRIGDTQLADFARPEVREMRFALIEETLQNYPVDGFELNLNHYAGGAFFHPDDMERGRSIFTSKAARTASWPCAFPLVSPVAGPLAWTRKPGSARRLPTFWSRRTSRPCR